MASASSSHIRVRQHEYLDVMWRLTSMALLHMCIKLFVTLARNLCIYMIPFLCAIEDALFLTRVQLQKMCHCYSDIRKIAQVRLDDVRKWL
jgi:hypothetical protein